MRWKDEDEEGLNFVIVSQLKLNLNLNLNPNPSGKAGPTARPRVLRVLLGIGSGLPLRLSGKFKLK